MKSTPFSLIAQYEELLGQLKSQRLDGKLILGSPRTSEPWSLYFHLGRVVYASGGTHTIRRFYRQIKTYSPSFDVEQASQALAPQCSLANIQKMGWDFEFLRLWHEQGLLSREQAHHIAYGSILEVLQDAMQVDLVELEVIKYEVDSNTHFFSLTNPIQLAESALQLWQKWEQAQLATYHFNDAPVILKPHDLKQKTSEGVYNTLSKLLDGENTLRDLAVLRKRGVIEITTSIAPYFKDGSVTPMAVPDLPTPKVVMALLDALVQAKQNATTGVPLYPPPGAGKPLIACVDDSPLVCQTMEKIFRSAGYPYLAIQDSLRAVPQLLINKPAVIFLDLVMPNTNGYEVCSQLRKTSQFKDTPIVILTGNDGIVDRVKARMVGATDFLGKPVNGETVLAVTERYLSVAKL